MRFTRQLACFSPPSRRAAGSAGCKWNQWLLRGPERRQSSSAVCEPLEAVTAVNANTQRVQTLQSQGAMLSIPGVPSVGAEIAIERPRKLRMKAGTQLLGPELDLGSNNELFWLWAARMPDPSVFFARHDQFAASRARQMLAVEPAWLIEALGLVEIDPASVIEGPHADTGDRLKLRTTLSTAGGQHTRLLVLHNKYAWVLEQHVYDEQGQLVASANSGHEYRVDAVAAEEDRRADAAGLLRLQLDVDRWNINQPLNDPQATFELPRSPSRLSFVDLADPASCRPSAAYPRGNHEFRSSRRRHRPRCVAFRGGTVHLRLLSTVAFWRFVQRNCLESLGPRHFVVA
jgi:hypothetical protein